VGRPNHAVNDEIQVYNAEIAKVGQWTIQFQNNYAINGRKEPDFDYRRLGSRHGQIDSWH
jgi:hypothetical protein